MLAYDLPRCRRLICFHAAAAAGYSRRRHDEALR